MALKPRPRHLMRILLWWTIVRCGNFTILNWIWNGFMAKSYTLKRSFLKCWLARLFSGSRLVRVPQQAVYSRLLEVRRRERLHGLEWRRLLPLQGLFFWSPLGWCAMEHLTKLRRYMILVLRPMVRALNRSWRPAVVTTSSIATKETGILQQYDHLV